LLVLEPFSEASTILRLSVCQGKIRLRKRHADSRHDTAEIQHAIRSAKAFERMLYRAANNQISRTQGAFGRIPSSQNGEDSCPFQLSLREIFFDSLFDLEEPVSWL
jgi:hypothetical protein